MPAPLLQDLHPDGPDEDLLDAVSGEPGDDLPVGPLPLDRLDAPFSEEGMADGPRSARCRSGRAPVGASRRRRSAVVARRRPRRRDLRASRGGTGPMARRTPPDGHGDDLGTAPRPWSVPPP